MGGFLLFLAPSLVVGRSFPLSPASPPFCSSAACLPSLPSRPLAPRSTSFGAPGRVRSEANPWRPHTVLRGGEQSAGGGAGSAGRSSGRRPPGSRALPSGRFRSNPARGWRTRQGGGPRSERDRSKRGKERDRDARATEDTPRSSQAWQSKLESFASRGAGKSGHEVQACPPVLSAPGPPTLKCSSWGRRHHDARDCE